MKLIFLEVTSMRFWIFILLMNLLIPITMIVFGKKYMIYPPQKINPLHGCRTALSMKSKETWAFAHQYSGRIWFVLGLILLPSTLLLMLSFLGKDENMIGKIGFIVCMVQLVLLMSAVPLTERVLKKHFNEDGKRI